jgi:hypothetical protein
MRTVGFTIAHNQDRGITAMIPEDEINPASEQNDDQAEYEAPRIESAMTPEDLAREVQYAGVTDLTAVPG